MLALEDLVREDPYDDARWLVLEDAILEQEGLRAEIVRREKEGLKDRAAMLRGGLLAGVVDAGWRAGYLVDARVTGTGISLREVLDAPASRLLRSLIVELDSVSQVAELGAIASSVCTRSLRALALIGNWHPAHHHAVIDAAVIRPLSLHRLFVVGRAMQLPPQPSWRTLRGLMIVPATAQEVNRMFATPAPELRDLAINARSQTTTDFLDSLFAARATPQLDQLRIDAPSWLVDDIVARITASPLLGQLRSLSFGNERVAPRSLGPAFAHLEVLAMPGP